jgi:hypothetical protein
MHRRLEVVLLASPCLYGLESWPCLPEFWAFDFIMSSVSTLSMKSSANLLALELLLVRKPLPLCDRHQ